MHYTSICSMLTNVLIVWGAGRKTVIKLSGRVARPDSKRF